jgi:5-hydroxyisourate hydrolase
MANHFISTHILDTTVGHPASGVPVVLSQKLADGTWRAIDRGETNSDGRYVFNCAAQNGMFEIEFQVESYFRSQQRPHFFLNSPVRFEITDTQRKYHVPLLLNPYGYSTYRGS